MKTDLISQKKFLNILLFSAFILLFILGYEWYNTIALNQNVNRVTAEKKNSKISVQFDLDKPYVDNWESVLQVSENPLDTEKITGETHSCHVINNSNYEINNWTIRFNMSQECYLNNFWCGLVEVHQFRDSKEIIERFDNNEIDFSKLKVDYNPYSKIPMIHLLPGDYFVYYPSVKEYEDVVKNNGSVNFGFIIYYQNKLDLTGYELTYHRNVKITDSLFFVFFCILSGIWIFCFILFLAICFVNRKYKVEVESSIYSISIMSDMYSEVHMLNLQTDTAYLIKGDKNNLVLNFFGCRISECISRYLEDDCAEKYREDLKNFFDKDSIKGKLEELSSFLLEFQDKKNNWYAVKIFKTNRNKKSDHVILAVQNINKEKERSLYEKNKLEQREYTRMFKGSFMNTVSYSVSGILDSIKKANQQLKDSVPSDKDKEIAGNIADSICHLELLQQCIFDMIALEADKFVLMNQEYNLNAIIERLFEILRPYYLGKDFEIQKVIDQNIPEKLEGDKERIMQMLMLLLISAFFVTEKGYVKLSVFAKHLDEYEELLFSVKNSATEFSNEQFQEVHSFLEDEKINSFDNPSLVYLKIIDGILRQMNSRLRVSSYTGEGTEFYFAIRQKISGQV